MIIERFAACATLLMLATAMGAFPGVFAQDRSAGGGTDASPATENGVASPAGPQESSDGDDSAERDREPVRESTLNGTPAVEVSGVEEPDDEGPAEIVIERLETTQEVLSLRLERMARWMDRFFAEDKVFDEVTDSYGRLGLDTVFEKGGERGFAGEIRLKLDLPRTERRLRLLIESDPQRDTKEDLETIPGEVVQDRDFFISLERQLRESGKWDIRPGLGIRARFPPDTFGRLRTFRYFDLDKWLLRVSGNAFWFDSSGWGTNGSLEFDRALSSRLLVRSTSFFGWEEEEKFRRAEQVFSLFQNLDRRRNMAYQIGIAADDELHWDTNLYFARIRYRQDVHENWLFAEIIPQWTFREETGFDREPSLTLRLEMVFGRHFR